MPFVFPIIQGVRMNFLRNTFFDKNNLFPIIFGHRAKKVWTFYENNFGRVVKTGFYLSGGTYWKTTENKLCVQDFRKLIALRTRKVSAILNLLRQKLLSVKTPIKSNKSVSSVFKSYHNLFSYT